MRHIPNILSGFRVALVPVFVWQMLEENTVAAAIVLLVSALTDFLDGFLARRFRWVSDLGKWLDPAADKLTQVTVCVSLVVYLREYWYFFVLLMLKDFIMLALGGRLLQKGVKLEGARWFGKGVTVLFYFTMMLLLFFADLPSTVIGLILAVVTVCSFCAGMLYLPQYMKYRKEAVEQKKSDGSSAAQISPKRG